MVNSVTWSPDSKRLASGGWDTTVRLWEADGTPGPVLKVDPPLKGNEGVVYAVAWSPDGQRVAAGYADAMVRLWSADGKPGLVLKGHTKNVFTLAWSPDGKYLASSGLDATIRLWEPDGKPGPMVNRERLPYVLSIAWSPDGKRLAASNISDVVPLLSLDSKEVPSLQKHRGAVRCVSWNADGRRIATGSEYGSIMLWDAATADPTAVLIPLADNQSATFSAAGQLLNGDPATIETGFVYLVDQGGGRLEVLKPSEFRKRAGLPN
jgi:WD40 repeat protein